MLDPRKPIRGIRTAPILLFSIAVLASITILLSGCGDDDEPKDVLAPTVSFTGLADQAVIWNTVSVGFDAQDKVGIASIDVYIDGILTHTITAAPFEYSWDTNTVTDGSHTIKVTATDKAGNTSDAEISVTVRNILVSVNVANNKLVNDGDYKQRGFVFLSDEAGKVIASTEYKNGDQIVLKNPSFNGEKFYLSEVLKIDEGDRDDVEVTTYTEVERGKNWVPLQGDVDELPYVGTAELNFTALGANSYYEFFWNDGGRNLDNVTQNVDLTYNPGNIFVARYDFDGNVKSYGLYPNITVKTLNTINLTQAFKPLIKGTLTIPDAIEIELSLKGYSEPGYKNGALLGQFWANQELKYYYPGTAFPFYYYELNFYGSGLSYYRGHNQAVPEVKNLEKDVKFTKSGDKVMYSASGNFDFLVIMMQDEGAEESRWYFVMPKGTDQVIPKLELPAAISGSDFHIHPINLPWEYVIYDFEGIDTYDELKDQIRQSTNGANDFFQEGKNYVYVYYYDMQLTNGRRGSTGQPRNPFSRKHKLRKN